MNKKIILTLVFCILFSIFSACGTEPLNEDENITNNNDSAEIDLMGATLKLYSGWRDHFIQSDAFSSTGDAQLLRFKECKELYNFEFIVMEYSLATESKVTASVASGEDVPDLIDHEAKTAYKLYKGGYLYPVDEIEAFDFTSTRWGTEAFLQYGFFGGNQYGLYWYDWDDPPHYAGLLMFNNELILEMNMDNPYEVQEKKQWVWDYFSEAIKIATVEDSISTQYGLGICNNPYFVQTVLFSNGAEILKVNNEGLYSCALLEPAALTALEYASQLYKSEYAKTALLTDFVERKFVFLSAESWQGTVMSATAKSENRPIYSMKDYGFLPFPSGKNVEPGEISSFVHSLRRMLWVVNGAENDYDDIGVMTNIVFSPLPGAEPENWKNLAQQYVFQHPEGYNNYINMIENVKYDYSAQLDASFANLQTQYNTILTGSRTPMAAIESVIEKINTACETEFNNK